MSRRQIPMISALSLGPLPELVQSEMGERAMRRVFRASGLTGDLLFAREGYIPQPALVHFFDAFARQAGERWVLGPWIYAIQIRDYGLWGNWVLNAPTLKEGLLRGCRSIQFHGTLDKLTLTVRNGMAEFCYLFAARDKSGYGELAIGGAAALVSYCREYLGPDWLPDRIDLDIPGLSRSDLDALEIHFGCRIGRADSGIRLVFAAHLLTTPRPRHVATALTYEDLVRERADSRPTTLESQVRSLVRRNLAEGLTGIEDAARSLDLAVRTLQQRLGVSGDSYRNIVKSVRLERARELMQEGALSITEIAFELGYEHPAHFSRMFINEVGVSPAKYAKLDAGEWA